VLHRIRSQPVFLSVCSMVKPIGKPDAGNPPVRFDERGRETERCRMAQATAPFLDSTYRRAQFGLLRLDVGRSDHLAPFLRFVRDELAELGG
jgi:hypothetical protein